MFGVRSSLRQFTYTTFVIVTDDDMAVCARGRPIEMNAEVRRRVDEMWGKLGI